MHRQPTFEWRYKVNIKKIRALADEAGVSILDIIGAMRHPEAWDWVFPHGPALDATSLSSEGRSELHAKLEEVRAGLMSKVRTGDIEAARLASILAIQQASLR